MDSFVSQEHHHEPKHFPQQHFYYRDAGRFGRLCRLTDAQCNEGAQPALVAGAAATPAAASSDPDAADTAAVSAPSAARRTATQRVAFVPAQIQHDSWTAPKANSRMLSRDVETLKAARLSMQVLDEASASIRHQRLAGLN
jgi:hypothetical protein